MPNKQRVQFTTFLGTTTTVPLDPQKAKQIADDARSVGATDIKITDAK